MQSKKQKISIKYVKGAVRFISIIIALSILFNCSFAVTAFADVVKEYNVTVVDDGETAVLSTSLTEPQDILEQAGISLDEDDLVDYSHFAVGQDSAIYIGRKKTVSISTDGKAKNYDVYASTALEAFKEAGFSTSDYKLAIDKDLPVKDGTIIEADKYKKITVKSDGRTKKVLITRGTVNDALALAGVKLDKNDYSKPKKTLKIKDKMKVTVYRVDYSKQQKTVKTGYKTKKVKDSTLTEGKKKVAKKGKKGKNKITYNVKYINGSAVSKKKIKTEVVSKPVTKVVKVGTKPKGVKGNGRTSYNGMSLGDTISGKYTHYCACGRCGTGSGRTASGRRVYNGMADPHYVACNWLPLGSVISVGGTKYTVVDRGGSGLSRRGRIDIFTPGGHGAALRKGTGRTAIKILRFGW